MYVCMCICVVVVSVFVCSGTIMTQVFRSFSKTKTLFRYATNLYKKKGKKKSRKIIRIHPKHVISNVCTQTDISYDGLVVALKKKHVKKNK